LSKNSKEKKYTFYSGNKKRNLTDKNINLTNFDIDKNKNISNSNQNNVFSTDDNTKDKNKVLFDKISVFNTLNTNIFKKDKINTLEAINEKNDKNEKIKSGNNTDKTPFIQKNKPKVKILETPKKSRCNNSPQKISFSCRDNKMKLLDYKEKDSNLNNISTLNNIPTSSIFKKNYIQTINNNESYLHTHSHQRTVNSIINKNDKEIKINQKILHFLNSKNTRNLFESYKGLHKNSFNPKEKNKFPNFKTNHENKSNKEFEENIIENTSHLIKDFRNMSEAEFEIYIKNLFLNKVKRNIEIIVNNLKNTIKADYNSEIIVNNLIEKKRFSYYYRIKDLEVFYCEKEYLKNFICKSLSVKKINKLTSEYKNYLECFCKPIFTNFEMNRFLKKNSNEKGEIYYMKNYGELKEEKEKRNYNSLQKDFFSSFLKNDINEAIDNINTNYNEENYFENLCVIDNYIMESSIDYDIYKLNKNFIEEYKNKLSNINENNMYEDDNNLETLLSCKIQLDALRRKSKILGYTKYKNDSFYVDLGKVECNFIFIEELEKMKEENKSKLLKKDKQEIDFFQYLSKLIRYLYKRSFIYLKVFLSLINN